MSDLLWAKFTIEVHCDANDPDVENLLNDNALEELSEGFKDKLQALVDNAQCARLEYTLYT